MQVSHRFTAESAVFDEDSLVSLAGLVPVMGLAEQTGLAGLLSEKVRISAPRVKSGSANPAAKLTTLVAGMCAGADSIEDIDVLRSGGMKTVFGGVYAPSTVGTLLREFTFGHARQLESVLREHLVALCGRVELLAGSDQRVFVDIDSLLRPVYGHAKQGASYGVLSGILADAVKAKRLPANPPKGVENLPRKTARRHVYRPWQSAPGSMCWRCSGCSGTPAPR